MDKLMRNLQKDDMMNQIKQQGEEVEKLKKES
jgi:hypothetical protein